MKISDLKLILRGDLARIDQVNVRDVGLPEDEVPIYPDDVRNMLRKYLAGKITADDLKRWAKFLCLRAEYCASDDPDTLEGYSDPNLDLYYYDEMWDVIHFLATPEIDGEINRASVTQYLSALEKYGSCCYQIMPSAPTMQDIELIKEGKVVIFEKSDHDWFIHFCDKNGRYLKQRIQNDYHAQKLSGIPLGILSRRVVYDINEIKFVKEIALLHYSIGGARYGDMRNEGK